MPALHFYEAIFTRFAARVVHFLNYFIDKDNETNRVTDNRS